MSALFELTLPADAQFVPMVRALAVHGARSAGCGEPEAETFGRKVEEALISMLAAGHPGASLTVTVRSGDEPLEVVIGSGRGARTLTLDT